MFAVVLLTFALAVDAAGGASTFERSTDKNVRQQIEALQKVQKRFRDTLDDTFKKSVIRGPNGEVDVRRFLRDFEEATQRLRNRMSGKYAASAEAAVVLEYGAKLDGYMRPRPDMKGASEWDRVAAELARLASSYGLSFPPQPGAQARRIGDGELDNALEGVVEASAKVKSALQKSAKSLPPAAAADRVAAAMTALGELPSLAKSTRSRLDQGKPATAQARSIAERRARVAAVVGESGMPDSVTKPWAELDAHLTTVAQGFGLQE